MAARKGLGKGIDAMISGDNTKTKQVVKEVVKEVDTIDINKIEPNNLLQQQEFLLLLLLLQLAIFFHRQ